MLILDFWTEPKAAIVNPDWNMKSRRRVARIAIFPSIYQVAVGFRLKVILFRGTIQIQITQDLVFLATECIDL